MKKILVLFVMFVCVFSFGGCALMADEESDNLRDKMLAAIEAEDVAAAAKYCVDDIASDPDSLEAGMKVMKEVIEGTSLKWQITSRSKEMGTGYSFVKSIYIATENGYEYKIEMTVDKYGETPLISYFYISRTEAGK